MQFIYNINIVQSAMGQAVAGASGSITIELINFYEILKY